MKSINKTPIIFVFLSLIALLAFAKQEKVLQIFRNGEVVQEYNISDIDYVEVNDIIDSPTSLKANAGAGQITISWNKVEGAIYNIYRSPDNVNFNLIASGLNETTYIDSKPLNGTNYYKVKAIVDGVESVYSSTIAGTMADNGLASGIYLGITGFNQTLYTYPVGQVAENSVDGFRNFVDGLTMKNGTLLYYSVDQAINTLQAATLPSDLSTAAIVTFTDGLDQGSMMMDVPYSDNTEYLDALNYRITNDSVSGQPITAYSIGIRGQDVADVSMFRNNLQKLASSNANAFEVSSMSEVNAKFKEIAEQLSQSNYIQTINLKMPGVANGTIVRFTFDNVSNAYNSTLYIEGTFNLSTRSLENVKYVGMTSTSGSTIKGTQEGIFVNLTIEGVHTDANVLIDNKFTDEWTYISSNGSWQINSEFDKTENSDIVTERSSAAILLVLDCSSSLGSDFATAQNNAKDFINTLYEAVGGDMGNGENPGENITIYSTTPKDLTLAIWKDGTRYYLTTDDYYKANLSDAVIEGLTIVAGGESFIISLRDIQSGSISVLETAKKLYEDIMPTADQGTIISAKWSDINTALSYFGGYSINSNRYYYTAATDVNASGYATNCIYGSGGNLYNTKSSPYVRGVKSTDSTSAIHWTDPNDLKLSVLINGKQEFLDVQEYIEKKESIDIIEGVAVIAGGEKFAIHLHDAQSGSISSVETARKLYGDIMPTAYQGTIISAKLSDINTALSNFGGNSISSNQYYYTAATDVDASGYATNCIYGSGGNLYNTKSSPYVRGVSKID
ncbi:MAG: hypothetical protein HDS41_04725 [Bacteroides sp.]|nr:hypothetical protein [Bacteroides sp.]